MTKTEDQTKNKKNHENKCGEGNDTHLYSFHFSKKKCINNLTLFMYIAAEQRPSLKTSRMEQKIEKKIY